MEDLKGKSVVITGASRGIGLGIARGFAIAGSQLLLIADEPAVLDRASDLGARGAIADITDKAAVALAMSAISDIDVLINNAGFERLTPILEQGQEIEDTFRRIIDVNIIGTHIVTRCALSRMKSGGSIVNTASIWGRVAEPMFDSYVASKHAIIGLTKTWAKELGPKNIRVNAVCPGWVHTPAMERSLAEIARRTGQSEDKIINDTLARQALSGLMEPADMASTYMFLASELSRNITGQSIAVDRGEVPW